jgi:hypothetical protein
MSGLSIARALHSNNDELSLLSTNEFQTLIPHILVRIEVQVSIVSNFMKKRAIGRTQNRGVCAVSVSNFN